VIKKKLNTHLLPEFKGVLKMDYEKDNTYRDLINEISNQIHFYQDLHLLKGFLLRLLRHLDKIESSKEKHR
jgi:hypothetical protein